MTCGLFAALSTTLPMYGGAMVIDLIIALCMKQALILIDLSGTVSLNIGASLFRLFALVIG